MNKIIKHLKATFWLLIISCTVNAQNQQANNSAKATFTIDSRTFDYGTIPEDGGLAYHTFIIKNTGSEPLAIRRVTATCGCTTPEWTQTPIAPDNTGEIKVAFNPKGRPGPFKKIITVICENADQTQLVITGNVGQTDNTPRVPVFSPVELSHDFGTISENDGYAEHTFRFKNTGNAPLVLSRVTASCGCTRPEWTQTPIEPGEDGTIIITFNPRGRLGNFNKTATVYTNESDGYKRHNLTIRGLVVDKPRENLFIKYVDTVGYIGLEKKNVEYQAFNQNGTNRDIIHIKNNNTETTYFSWDNVPDHITVNYPDSLKADWPGEITVLVDGTKTTEMRGRVTDKLKLTLKDGAGNVLGSETISVTAIHLDDFSKLSPLQKVSAPSIEITNTQLEFGSLKRGSANKQFVITNTGKADMTIHSLSSDDQRISLPDINGTTIEAGKSLTVKVTIRAKEIGDENIKSDIYIVSNAPKSPVRKILVTAQKN